MKKSNSDIINKYILGTSDKEELEKAMSVLEDPYHNLELRPTLYGIWHRDITNEIEVPEPDEFSGMLNEIHHKINLENKTQKKSNVKKLLINVSRIAAILVIAALIGIIAQNYKNAEPVYFTSIAPKGSVSQMVLPDNSIVYLNAGSQLKYTVEGLKGKREVFLDGEAWFDVTKNEKKPFIVHTPFYDVKVLGTQFNVKAYKTDNEIVTTLEKGIVQIASSENFKMAENKTLRPGEQLVYSSLKKAIEVKKVDTQMFTAWKDNKLIFINMNLNELIVLLERKYGVEIETSDNIVLNYHYDGTIKDETILEVLDLLKETLPIKYKIEGQTIVITKK